MESVCPLTVDGFDLPESFTLSTMTADKGTEMLEEMEREETGTTDGTATTGANNAS